MALKALLIKSDQNTPNGEQGVWASLNNIASAYIKGIQTGNILNNINAQTLQALISGVPSPWARAKLFKFAIDTIANPINMQGSQTTGLNQYYNVLLGEWKGLLAVVALYPDRIKFSNPLSLNTSGVDYNISSAFGRMLFDDSDIWTNQKTIVQNPGAQPFIQLIYYREHIIGGTSPLTAVFTGVDYSNIGNVANDIPWYRGGIFTEPDCFLNPNQLQKLYLFIKNINSNSSNYIQLVNSQRGNKPKINLVHFQTICQKWESCLLNRGNNQLMNIGPIARYNNLSSPFDDLFNSNVPVYMAKDATFTFTNAQGSTLIGDINSLLSNSQHVVGWSEEATIANSLFNGPVYLLKVHDLNADHTYLFSIPLSEKAIEIFQSSMSSMLGYMPTQNISMKGEMNDNGQLVVTLSLQVDGRNIQLNPREYDVLWQDKPQKVIMWPNFISNDWNRYYLYSQKTDATQPAFLPFFKDINTGGILKDRFGSFLTIDNLPTDGTPSPVRVKELVKKPANAGDQIPNYQIQLLDKPIKGLKAMVSQGVQVVCAGYLILRQNVVRDLTARALNNTAIVGFDFGSNNTCVFFRDTVSNSVHPIAFNNYRTMLVGQETIAPNRVAELDELLFFSNYESNNGQFKSWLQEHNSCTNPYTQMDEISGGVPVNRPNVQVNKMTDRILETQAGTLHYNMKWLNDDLGLKKKRAFIKSLWLQVCAFLYTNNITPTNLSWSYPGAMMNRDINELQQTFQQLQTVTPIQSAHVVINNGVTEAEAVCSYAVDLNGFGLTINNIFLGIDVGGSTSDILLLARDSINGGQNTLFSESSIRLAAGVFFKAVTGSQQFRNALVTFHGGHNTSVNVMNIDEISRSENKNKAPYYLNCIFDQLKPGEYDLFYQSLAANAKIAFTIPAYVTGALLYYSGMLIGKELKLNKLPTTLNQVEILPFGKGGRLFHWLYQVAGSNATDSYYSACLNAGIQCVCERHVEVNFRSQIADNNKTEVARGLCAIDQNFVKADNLGNTDICGEKNVYFRKGAERESISVDQVLDGNLFSNPAQFELSQLDNFNKFMELFLGFVCKDTNIYNGDEQQLRKDLSDLPGSIANFITNDPEYQKAMQAGLADFPYHQPMIVSEIAAYLQKLIQSIFAY